MSDYHLFFIGFLTLPDKYVQGEQLSAVSQIPVVGL